MHRLASRTAFPLAVLVLFACSSSAPSAVPAPTATTGVDAGAPADAGGVTTSPDTGAPVPVADAAAADDGGDAGGDAGTSNACEWGGAPGECITLTACAALGNHTSFAGQCPGPADIQCCITTPNTADNPPIPAGYQLMQQAQVTADMTTWAVAILDDPSTYPMFSTTTKTFGTVLVLARVEWHPPDFQNSVVHRGVTLYVPL